MSGELAWAREQLLAGQAIGDYEIKARFPEVSWGGAASKAVRRLEEHGHVLVRERLDGHSVYRLAESPVPVPVPVLAEPERNLAELRAAARAEAELAEALGRRARALAEDGRPPLPELGSTLTVRWLRLEEGTDEVLIGLANGSHIWNVVLDAVAQR